GLDPSVPARVFLDGRLIPTDQRFAISAGAGSLLTIRVIPQGGQKTGGILTQLAALGAAVAGFVIGGPLVASLAYAGASMVGMLVTNALVPPSSPVQPELTGDPKLFTVSGSDNVAAPYSAIPRILGVRKIAPMLAAGAYTELVGEDE